MHNTAWDSLEFEKLDFPYNRIESELSGEPRFIRGRNAYVTLGGKLCKRPGNTEIENTFIANKRIDRLWIYETLETPPKVYIVASMFDTLLSVWQMWYIRLSDATPAWTQFTSLRQINASTRPHEAVTSKGLLYVKGYPSAASGEKLGTVIMDGTGGTPIIRFWGLLPPTTPMAVVGAVTKTTATITDTGLTLNVSSDTGFPATPFTIQVEDEQMSVTAGLPGTAWTVTRGFNGTTAAAHDTGEIVLYRNWAASAHQVDVLVGWAYTYAFKTSTGQVSSRAPLETNLDKLPSRTGPFHDLVPKFTCTGDADTTNIPNIIIFRSTDGGGTFFELEEIVNPGAGSFQYLDDSFESGVSGGTFNDPVPDSELDQGTRAPTLVSNGPPPTVIAPEVIGTDTPIASTPPASYSARLWIGIGNILFYSGQEEILLGIPEESWPSGINGNFFRFQYPITNIASTSSALYIFTLQGTYELTGTNKETFNVRPIFENLGAPYGHPRALARYEDNLILLTQDFRIGKIRDSELEVLSDPLFTDLIDTANQGAEFDIKFWGDLEKEWIMVAGHNTDDSELSKQWVFDIKKSKMEQKPFWYIPWHMRISAIASGRIIDNLAQRRFVFAMYDQSGNGSTCLVKIDPTGRTGSDFFVTDQVGFDFDAVTNLFLVPAGNHVNKLRQPGVTPDVYGISLDRLIFAGDTDPNIYYFKDDFWTDPISPVQYEDPARRELSKQYKTLIFGIHEVAQHVAVEILKLASAELFECQNLIIEFAPDKGA